MRVNFWNGVPEPSEKLPKFNTLFRQEKGDWKNMAKRTELKCPYCDAVQMRVKNRKEAELICHNCGASLLVTKDESGALYISARPRDYEPPKVASGQ